MFKLCKIYSNSLIFSPRSFSKINIMMSWEPTSCSEPLKSCCINQLITLTIKNSTYSFVFTTLQNTFGPNGPAIALRVVGDRAAFYACRFLSFQDTLLDDGGRHYFRSCFIQGTTDFIFGNGLSFYEVFFLLL